MPPITDIVEITITRETTPATRSSFGIALVIGDSGVLRDKDVIYLDIDAQFVASNVIAGTINGDAITPVNYSTDSDTTMGLLATEIASHADVATAVPSDPGGAGYDTRLTITAAAVDTPILLTSFAVTGGASQPTITITRNAFQRTKTYTTLAGVAADFATTDPEYLAASAFFGQSPNPGTLKIGRVDAAEDWDDALTAIIAVDNTWYGLGMTDRTSSDVQDVAAWVEAQGTAKNYKLFVTASDDPNILSSGATSDIAYIFSAAEYDRTITLYHGSAATSYPEVAWLAEMLSYDPGEATWKFKTLDNFDADILTSAQRTAALAKYANLYETYGDVDITHEGQVASSEFADVIRGVDWLESTMASAIYAILATSPKVPYTNAGIAAVEAEVRASLDSALAAGVLRASPDDYEGMPYRVTTKKLTAISVADRSNRLLPSDAIVFEAKVAGAIHKVEVSGTVAV